MIYGYIRLAGEEGEWGEQKRRLTAARVPVIWEERPETAGRPVLTRLLVEKAAEDLVVLTVADLTATLLDLAREQYRSGQARATGPKLSPYEEREVRRRLDAETISLRELAREFGVHVSTVCNIRDGKHGHQGD